MGSAYRCVHSVTQIADEEKSKKTPLHRRVFSLLRTGWVGAMALAEMSHAVRVCRLYRRALINVR